MGLDGGRQCLGEIRTVRGKRLLADLIESDVDDAQFDAKLKVLEEQIKHHVAEEEGELFPKVEKLVGQQELEDLAVVMQDTAEELEQGEPRQSIPGETSASPSSIRTRSALAAVVRAIP